MTTQNQSHKKEYKNIVFGFLFVGLICLFIHLTSKNEISALEETKSTNAASSKIALDSINAISMQSRSTEKKVDRLSGEVSEHGKVIDRMEQSQTRNFNDLKKFKNEKNTIPPATVDQQYDYLSNYKYQAY